MGSSCSQDDVRSFQMFNICFQMFKDFLRMLSIGDRYSLDFLRCIQMYSDVLRCLHMIFFFHIYLARVSRLMSKSFDILCTSPASTNRNINKFTKCEHFTASNKCRAVSFDARSSLMFSLIWIGAAWSAPLAACTAVHTKGAFFPASQYILRLATSVKLKSGL